MSKKYIQKKPINFVRNGYVIYDDNLMPDRFIDSLNKIIKLNDIFDIVIENKKTLIIKEQYLFDHLKCTDHLDCKVVISKLNETPLKRIAEFKLIFIKGDLKGFYYRFNGFLFDNRAVVKVLENIEKRYFNHDDIPTKKSYINWIKDNPKSFAMTSKHGLYECKSKLLTIDEYLTKNIRDYIKLNDITLFQFMTGIIGVYYKVSKQKDLIFMTEYFDNKEEDLIGDLSQMTSYSLKKNANVLCSEFINNDWIQLEKDSHIIINKIQDLDHLKGQVTNLHSFDIPFEMDFSIGETLSTIELDITYQKHKSKKDDLFLMCNKLKMIIHDVLEKDTILNDLSLLTKKEELIVFKHINASVTGHYVSVYDQFITLVDTKGSFVAIEGDKQVTFLDLYSLVEKIRKSISKVDIMGQTIDVSLLNNIDKIAAFIAMDSVGAVYSDQCNYQLKKNLLGFKLSKVMDGQIIDGQYFIDNSIISREGYIIYCKYLKDYLKLTHEDVVSDDDFIKFGIPILLAGGRIKIKASNEEVTICEIESNELRDYPKMRHVFTNDKKIHKSYSYKLHFAVSLFKTVPFSFIGPIHNGRLVNILPVNGLGFVILNRDMKLCQVYEKGDLYIYGPSVSTKFDYDAINVNGTEIKYVIKSHKRGTWFLDGSLRL